MSTAPFREGDAWSWHPGWNAEGSVPPRPPDADFVKLVVRTGLLTRSRLLPGMCTAPCCPQGIVKPVHDQLWGENSKLARFPCWLFHNLVVRQNPGGLNT